MKWAEPPQTYIGRKKYLSLAFSWDWWLALHTITESTTASVHLAYTQEYVLNARLSRKSDLLFIGEKIVLHHSGSSICVFLSPNTYSWQSKNTFTVSSWVDFSFFKTTVSNAMLTYCWHHYCNLHLNLVNFFCYLRIESYIWLYIFDSNMWVHKLFYVEGMNLVFDKAFLS